MSEEMLDYGEKKNNLLVYKSKEQVADICIAHYKEIERLNNIINEYEKLLYIIRDDNGLEHLWCKDLIFDKLQELKGSDK